MDARGSRVLLLGLLALVVALPSAAMAQDGQVPQDEPAQYTIEVRLGGGTGDETFDIKPEEITVPPGANVTFHVVNLQATGHDFALMSNDKFEFSEEDLREAEGGQGQVVKTPLLDAGEEYNLTVTFNEDASGTIDYICSVSGHDGLGMEGTISVGATGGGGEEEGITGFGVHYLAYWVGMISFVIIFVVLFGTFFYFRYGETKHAVDHRTGGPKTVTVAAGATEGEGKEMVEPILPSPRSVAMILAIIAVLGAAFYFLL